MFICMSAIGVQTAVTRQKTTQFFNRFFKNSIIKMSRATPDTSASLLKLKMFVYFTLV